MEKKCINCKHFRRGSVGPTRSEYIWGDCFKMKQHFAGENNPDSILNFTWANECCGHFEPKNAKEDYR